MGTKLNPIDNIAKGKLNTKQLFAVTQSIHMHILVGDLGYYDETEHIFIVDRLKDVIKYKTMQVSLLIPFKLSLLILSSLKIQRCPVNEVVRYIWKKRSL